MSDFRWPALPDEVHLPLGPVPVVIVAGLRAEDGDKVRGLWVPSQRAILVDEGPLSTMWTTLYHEEAHAILHDLDIDVTAISKDELEEKVVEAIAIARTNQLVQERRLAADRRRTRKQAGRGRK